MLTRNRNKPEVKLRANSSVMKDAHSQRKGLDRETLYNIFRQFQKKKSFEKILILIIKKRATWHIFSFQIILSQSDVYNFLTL